jgi:hypothetical protein
VTDTPTVRRATLKDFKADPQNVRKHNERNLAAVVTSLSETGFGRPILAASNGTVLAGNLTSEALADLGMEDVLVIETDGRRPIIHVRSDLEAGSDDARKAAFYDNRAAELADGYDAELLASLIADVDLAPTLLTAKEAAELIALGGGDDDDDDQPEPASQWMVIIDCHDEAEQTALLQRFLDEDLVCRALTS